MYMAEQSKKVFGMLTASVAILIVLSGMPLLAQEHTHILFEDIFENGPQLWSVHSSTWDARKGALLSSPTLVGELMGGHPEWRDVTIHLDLELLAGLEGNAKVQVLYRWQGSWQGYGLIFTSDGAQFVRFEGGPRQFQVLAATERTLPSHGPNEVKVVLSGRRMTAYLDNEAIMQAMDPVHTHQTGQIGLRTEGTSLALRGVRVTGSTNEAVVERTWLQGRTEMERLMDSFPPMPATDGIGYYPPGIETAGGAHNIMLIYTHSVTWNVLEALPYVAYGELVRKPGALPRLEWLDWFFDTFLFLSLNVPNSERAYDSATRGTSATWDDWLNFMATLFRPDAQFGAFDQAVAQVKHILGDDSYRAKVIVMIPYPEWRQYAFGDPMGDGQSLNFNPNGREEGATEARMTAVKAYIDTFLQQWEAHAYENLEFIGFYWLAESIASIPGERTLIERTAKEIQSKGYHFFWIPHFEATSEEWSDLHFDAALLQPNYMFNTRLSKNRLMQAAQRAQQAGMGIEIEADGTILTSQSGRERYYDYLWGGIKYGYMNSAIKAYYQDHRLYGAAFMSTNPEVREIYDQTYLFAKGLLGRDGAADN